MELLMKLCLVMLLYTIFLIICKWILKMRNHCCYMLHYECYKSTDDRKLDSDSCSKIAMRSKNLGIEELKFLLQTMVNSGIGEHTYGPRNVLEAREEFPTLVDAFYEMDDIIFQTLDNLFAKYTGVISPSQIDILVVNVSLFSPSPSLTARVINRYKMRENIKAFNLSGMGCSASLVAVNLVHNLFKVDKNSFAIVVSTESIGPHWYCGKEKSMLLSNCLFRSGGCSMLLTNRTSFKKQAIMKLNCLVRTDIGSNDEAYGCCIQIDDKAGHQGFLLTKFLKVAAGIALTANLKQLIPKMLPLNKLVPFIISFILKKKTKSTGGGIDGLNLKSGAKHFCIHPGGKAVIESVGKSLQLTDYDLEPAKMALHRFGNTSAGGLWYVLGYMEAKKRLKKGDRIVMISLGAGFMCNNCVWEVLKDMRDENVWEDCIDFYPIVPNGNLYLEKFGWINNESLSFVKLH